MEELNNFLAIHKYDPAFLMFMYQIPNTVKESSFLHSDIWSKVYDFINDNYPNKVKGTLVTELTNHIEKEIFSHGV